MNPTFPRYRRSSRAVGVSTLLLVTLLAFPVACSGRGESGDPASTTPPVLLPSKLRSIEPEAKGQILASPSDLLIRGENTWDSRRWFSTRLWLCFAAPKEAGTKYLVAPLEFVDQERTRQIVISQIKVDPNLVWFDSGAGYGMVSVDVPANLHAGRYKGALLVSGIKGTTLKERYTIPVTVEIRDSPVFAFLLLFFGVVVTLVTEWYQRYRRTPDGLYARAADMAYKVEADTYLSDSQKYPEAAVFRRRFAELVRAAVFTQSVAQDKEAQAKIIEAEGLWVRWSVAPETWVRILNDLSAEAAAVKKRFRALPAIMGVHSRAVLDGLENTIQNAPHQVGIGEFEKTAKARIADSQRYLKLWERLDSVRKFITGLPPNDPVKKDLRARIDAAGAEWEKADITKPDDVKALETKLREEADAVEKAVREALPQLENLALDAARMKGKFASATMGTKDDLIPRSHADRVKIAGVSRQAYAVTVSVVVLLLVTFKGFEETYGKNYTFGADPVADYLGVAIWAVVGNFATRATLGIFSGGLPAPLRRLTREPSSGGLSGAVGAEQDGASAVDAGKGGAPAGGAAGANGGGDRDNNQDGLA